MKRLEANTFQSRADVVSTWFEPSGVTQRLSRAQLGHAQSDAKLLQRLAGEYDQCNAIAQSWKELVRATACSGMRSSGTLSGQRRFAIFALAELCALSGATADFCVEPGTDAFFPIAGATLEFPSGASGIGIHVTARLIELDWGGRSITLELPALPANRQRTVTRHGVAIDFPDLIHGVRVWKRPPLVSHFLQSQKARIGPLTPSRRSILQDALTAIEEVRPDLLSELRQSGCSLVPVEALDPATTGISWSDPNAHGLIFLGIETMEDTMDLLIHEYAHLKLCLLQETYHLLENHSIPVLAPWRKDVRSAEGLVHGIYAFYQVARTFETFNEIDHLSEQMKFRLHIWCACLIEAFSILENSKARLTIAGESLFSEIEAYNLALKERLLSDDAVLLSEALGLVREHLAQAGHPDSKGPWFLGI